MEFELEELETWLAEDGEAASANHAPAWCREGATNGQTGVWIPEESPAPTAKQLEPAD